MSSKASPGAVGRSPSTKRRRVFVAGYLALDAVLFKDRAALRAGGTAGNVAANLAFLGWRADVVGRIGADTLGTALAEDLGKSGVCTGLLEASTDASTPVVFHHVSPTGPRYTFRCPSCGRKLGRHSPPRSEVVSELLDGHGVPDVFFFDRASKAIVELAGAAREAGALVVFEPSTAGVAHLFQAAVKLAHIVKYSSERAAAVAAALPRKPRGQLRVVTKGAGGLAISSPQGWRSVASFRTQPVDPAGAGDWTTAGFLAALPSLDPKELDHDSIRDALQFGQAVAAMSCSFVGARGMAVKDRLK